MTALALHCGSLGYLHVSGDRGSPACEPWQRPLLCSVDTHSDQFEMALRDLQELGVACVGRKGAGVGTQGGLGRGNFREREKRKKQRGSLGEALL